MAYSHTYACMHVCDSLNECISLSSFIYYKELVINKKKCQYFISYFYIKIPDAALKYFPKYKRSKSQRSIEKLSSILQFLRAYITSLKEIINRIYENYAWTQSRDGWVLFRHMSKTLFMILKACNRWKKRNKNSINFFLFHT